MRIEVDNLDAVYAGCQEQGFDVVYPMTHEPWGVRRFFVVDPFGKTVNIMEHVAQG